MVRHTDFFKHVRKLGSYRRIHIPKMLKVVEELIQNSSIAGSEVVT